MNASENSGEHRFNQSSIWLRVVNQCSVYTLCWNTVTLALLQSLFTRDIKGIPIIIYVWIHWTRYQTQFIKMNHVIIWGGFTFLWEDVDLCHVCRETQTEIFQVVSPYIFKNVSMSVFCKITSSVTGSDVILEGKHQNISKYYQRIWWILGCFVVLVGPNPHHALQHAISSFTYIQFKKCSF